MVPINLNIMSRWLHVVFISIATKGTCGGCYAFSVAAAFEGALAIATQKPAVKLSEEDMLECATPPNVMCAGKLSVHAVYGGIMIGLHVRMCICALSSRISTFCFGLPPTPFVLTIALHGAR